MKILVFRRSAGTPVANPPQIYILPDSAVTMANRPLFLPDFASEWEGYVAPAFRINRLGKEISRKYASRYYDAVALTLRLVPVGIDGGTDSDIFHVFDNCLTLTPWQPLCASDDDSSQPRVTDSGNISVEWQGCSTVLTPEDLRIDEAIEAVSHYCTLKTGDVIIPATLHPAVVLRPDTLFTASLNSPPFTLKIK